MQRNDREEKKQIIRCEGDKNVHLSFVYLLTWKQCDIFPEKMGLFYLGFLNVYFEQVRKSRTGKPNSTYLLFDWYTKDFWKLKDMPTVYNHQFVWEVSGGPVRTVTIIAKW